MRFPLSLPFPSKVFSLFFIRRYLRRGGEENGNVANFVETEQILQRMDGKASTSFLQVRCLSCTFHEV